MLPDILINITQTLAFIEIECSYNHRLSRYVSISA